MPRGYPHLGPAGALVQLPSPAPGYEQPDILRGGTHELVGGGNVRDRIPARRRYTLSWPAISDDHLSTIRTLTRLPGPYRYLHPLERNLLTVNQSTGTDELRTTEGVVARFQGVCSSDTAQTRSGTRSIKWDSQAALSISGRGPYLYTSEFTLDGTWTAVRPSTQYTFSGYARASAAVSFQALIDWHDATGAFLSVSLGTGTAVGTGDFNTRLSVTATSPATAAYGIGAFINTTTPGATRQVWFDDLQLEEGASVTNWRLGAGTPLVAVDSFAPSIVIADGAVGTAYHAVELTLVEL